MIIILLAKITKMSWFDHPEIQGVIQNLFNLQTMGNERLLLLSLTAIHDIIIEMSYVHRVKNLNVNRRISLSFRDSQLYAIFKQSLQHVDHFINQVSTQQAMQQIAITNQNPMGLPERSNMMTESLLQALCILERALSFDFTAILLNETLDDPITTNIPTSWAPFIVD